MTGPHLIAASAFGSVHGLLHSTAFHLARNLFFFVVAVFWLGLAYWVYRDVRRRVDDAWLVWTATLLALVVPFLGPVVYLLFRAPETLHDARARELEVRALEDRLDRHAAHCPVCRADVSESFLVCPVCTTQLKQACRQCSAALDASWQVCPYCVTPVVEAPHLVDSDLDTALRGEVAAATANARPQPKRVARRRAS